jgi:hypothetical protein
VLNHAKGVDADGRGDIPPGWCDSILSGLGSAGPEYMLKYTSLNEPYASVVFQKNRISLSQAWLYAFLCSLLQPDYTDPGRFGWRGAEGAQGRCGP